MPGQNTNDETPVQSQENFDPWAAAFEQLEKKDEGSSETTPDGGGTDEASQGEQANSQGVPGQTELPPTIPEQPSATPTPNSSVPSDSTAQQNTFGGSDTNLGGSYQTDTGEATTVSDWTDADLEEYQNNLVHDIEQQAMDTINKQMVDSGQYLSFNGTLGANIYDERICKRDRDGVPHFYNAETGQEFRGDNPRQQAIDYVNSYNAQLAPQYNYQCRQEAQRLLEEAMPQVEVLRFAPTYEKMDPIRKNLFDGIVSSYEIKNDANEVIGYSCDLNSVLASVNNQVTAIQDWYNAQQQTQQGQANTPPASSSPALDMKSSIGNGPKDRNDVKNVEDALLFYQNQIIEKGNK